MCVGIAGMSRLSGRREMINMAEYFKWGTEAFILALLCVCCICAYTLIVDNPCPDCTGEPIVLQEQDLVENETTEIISVDPFYDICTTEEYVSYRTMTPFEIVEYNEFFERKATEVRVSEFSYTNMMCVVTRLDYNRPHAMELIRNTCNETTAYVGWKYFIENCTIGNESHIQRYWVHRL